MNDKVKRRERRIDIAIIALAVIITALFHIALLFLFSPPVVADVRVKQFNNRIVMLSDGGKNMHAGKSILNWMKYRDPTLIAKPSGKYGFGRLQPKNDFRKMTEDIPLTERMTDEHQNVSGFKKLPEAEKEDGAYPHKLWGALAFSPEPEFARISSSPARSDFPAWKNSKGETLGQIFSTEEKKMILTEVEKLKPEGETVISIQFRGENILPRFRVIKSCGFSALDRKAIKALILNSSALFSDEKRQENIAIEWRPLKAK